MAKLAGGTPPPKPVRTPPIKRPPVPVVTPRGTFTPGVQPWVNPRAAESAAIGQAVAGAINTVAGAITTGPGGQVGRGSIGVGDWRILAGRYGASRTAAMQAAQQDREQAYVLMARYGMAPPELIPGTSSYQERQRTLTARYSAH